MSPNRTSETTASMITAASLVDTRSEADARPGLFERVGDVSALARAVAAVSRLALAKGRPVLEAAPESEASEAIRGVAEAIQARRQGQIRKALTVL